jgi:hypothetical protein
VLYFNDVEAGGETVFTQTTPPDKPYLNDTESLQYMRSSDRAALVSAAGIEPDSWEEKLCAKCQTRLAIAPKKVSF